MGELLQPGGYLMLKRLGLEACVDGIDSVKVRGAAGLEREWRRLWCVCVCVRQRVQRREQLRRCGQMGPGPESRSSEVGAEKWV